MLCKANKQNALTQKRMVMQSLKRRFRMHCKQYETNYWQTVPASTFHGYRDSLALATQRSIAQRITLSLMFVHQLSDARTCLPRRVAG